MLEFEPERGFGIYIHWPYCAKICPYCDFNVYAAKQRDIKPMLEAIHADLKNWRQKTGPRRVDTIFFGGGTPSLLPSKAIEDLIDKIDTLWDLHPAAEITLEANPDDAEYFADLAHSGVNRLSLGVQSLNDESLVFLGRNHNAQIAMKAIEEGRRYFESLSLDFIYALPNQSLDSWHSDLEKIMRLGADHLSLYELTIEKKTAFGKAVERGEWLPATEDTAADLYDLTQDLTEQNGFSAYEISNHALSLEHHAKHNIIYWRSGDWLGVGPGAHGRITINGNRYETISEMRPEKYIDCVTKSKTGCNSVKALSIDDVASERLVMGLRMATGIKISDFEDLSGTPLNPVILSEFAEDGLLIKGTDTIRLTQSGRLLADYISSRLLVS